MRRWQQISAIALGLVVLLSWAGKAMAQGGADLPPILGDVLVKIAVVIDGVLGFWVSGNTLTDPWGQQLASSLATLANNMVNFLAEFFEVLTFG